MSSLPVVERLGDVFAQTSGRNADTYIYSLPYYLLTGRKGASVYSQNDTHLVVCKHPHIDERLMVFPEINGDGTLTMKVLNALDIPKNGIQLARYSQEDFKKLQTAGMSLGNHKGLVFSEIDEAIMDWKYPVHILNTQKTSQLRGNLYEKLRNKFNKASQVLEIVPIEDSKAIKIMRSSLHFWMGMMVYTDKETGHSLGDFYESLFGLIEKYPSAFGGFTVISNGEPAGFTVWDKPAFGVANGIASLSRQSIKGMAEYQMITACKILSEQGVRYYNMGGSETEGLDTHKKEYRPEFSIPLSSYEISASNLNGFEVQALVI